LDEKVRQLFLDRELLKKSLPVHQNIDSAVKAYKVWSLTKNVFATVSNSTARDAVKHV
jgi:hypothetical protein